MLLYAPPIAEEADGEGATLESGGLHCVVAPFGYQLGQQMLQQGGEPLGPAVKPPARGFVCIRPNRKSVSDNIPSHEQLMAIKHRKKVPVFPRWSLYLRSAISACPKV